ncbi:hypothetical protein D3C83_37170 [compost metagenome]
MDLVEDDDGGLVRQRAALHQHIAQHFGGHHQQGRIRVQDDVTRQQPGVLARRQQSTLGG